MYPLLYCCFNDAASTQNYTLSLHDALPISPVLTGAEEEHLDAGESAFLIGGEHIGFLDARSEEHTSELQSHVNLVCRLLLEKKKTSAPLPRSGWPTRIYARGLVSVIALFLR